jgi:hypothetical protein
MQREHYKNIIGGRTRPAQRAPNVALQQYAHAIAFDDLLATIAGDKGRAFVMEARLAGRYRALMWLLLLPTFGVGTLGLWAYSLRWPRIVDGEGIRLRSGRQVPWAAIKGLGVVKSRVDAEVTRLDIHFEGGVAQVPVGLLDNGPAIANEIRAKLPQLKRH